MRESAGKGGYLGAMFGRKIAHLMLQEGAIGCSLSGGNWVLKVALRLRGVGPEPGSEGFKVLATEGQVVLYLSPEQLPQISGHIWIVPASSVPMHKSHCLQK